MEGAKKSMFDTVQDHEMRIGKLEVGFDTISGEMKTLMTKMSTIENAQLTTQNMILVNKQDNDKLLNQMVEQNGEIIRHTLDIKKEGKVGFWKVAGIAVGSGGALVVGILGVMQIVEKFM